MMIDISSGRFRFACLLFLMGLWSVNSPAQDQGGFSDDESDNLPPRVAKGSNGQIAVNEVTSGQVKLSNLLSEAVSVEVGAVRPGQRVMVNVKLLNDTNSDVSVEEAEVSCGCVSPRFPHSLWRAGQENIFQLGLNSGVRNGARTVTIDLSVQHGQNPRTLRLFVKWLVQPSVEIYSPHSIINVRPESSKQTTLTLRANGTVNLDGVQIAVSPPSVDVVEGLDSEQPQQLKSFQIDLSSLEPEKIPRVVVVQALDRSGVELARLDLFTSLPPGVSANFNVSSASEGKTLQQLIVVIPKDCVLDINELILRENESGDEIPVVSRRKVSDRLFLLSVRLKSTQLKMYSLSTKAGVNLAVAIFRGDQ